jgi:hypothetical protein
MELKKIIFAITGLLFLMMAPAALAWIPHSSNIPAERTKSLHPFELSRQSIVVAENEPDRTESGGQPANENENQAPDSGTADSEKSGSDSDDAATKPIKPFKPSEEIAAEQAVDFPVDI